MTITAAELLVKVGADTSDAESGLKSFSGKLKNVGGQMAAVGGVLSATVAAPLIGIAVSAVKTAADFEKSMNVLGYASGATSKQMQALSDQALQLGADTVFSANEAAEGMVDLAKAGMKTEDIMGAIPGVMDLAAAGQIGVSEAATLTAATLSTFNLEATEAAHVADVLAAAANASTADVKDLAFGVQNAGSVFSANGQSVETLATMMALLANNGIDAGTAATQLKTMTLRLTAPTQIAAKAMKSLGLQVFDAKGNMRDYHDIIQDLSAATRDMSGAQKDAAFQTIFGFDAINAANIFAKEGVTAYEDMAKAVTEQGAAAAMAEAQNKGLSGALQSIAGTIESLGIKLATPFEDDLKGWTDSLNEFVQGLGNLPQPVINAGLAFGGFAVAVSLGAAAIGGLILILPALTSPIGLLALGLLALGAATAALWAAWELNFGNIQGTLAPFIAALTTAGTAVQNFGQYVGEVVTSGSALNIWLFTLPPGLDAIAYSVGQAIVTLEGFGAQLSNLGHYLLDVALKGVALNIWLFTMTPAIASFALMLGNGIVALQNFAASAANFKMPDITSGLQKLKSNVELQVNATVKTLLNPPVLTIAPFPPMTIDPPIVTIAPIPPQTIKTVAQGPADMIANLRTQIQGADWAGTGKLLGDVIILSWNTEVAKIAPFLNLVGVGLAFTDAFGQFQTNFVGALLGLSLAIGSTDVVAQIIGLGVDLVSGFTTLWTNLVGQIMGAVTKSADATSTSDMLRDRALGSNDNAIARFGAALASMTEIVSSFVWPAVIAGFTWPAVIASFGWPLAIAAFAWPASLAFSWGTWMDHLNWGDFIGWLAIPTGGGGNSGGSGVDRPLQSNPNDPRMNAMGTSYWTGGSTWVGEHGPELVSLPQGSSIYSNQDSMAMAAGGVTINVNVASINNGMDIEQLAAQLARRFQQKLRL